MTYPYKLTPKIPGITVTLTHNPLNAKIELTEAAKREVVLLKALEDLMENYVFSAKWRLERETSHYDPADARKHLEMVLKPWFEEQDKGTDPIEMWKIVTGAEYILDDLAEEHGGDCTCAPASCTRCHAEDLIGINTLPVSKSIGHRMWRMYAESEYATDQDKQILAEQDRRAAEYDAKYPSKLSPEAQAEYKAKYEPVWEQQRKDARAFFEYHINKVNKAQP